MKTIGFVVPYFTCGNGTVHPMTQLWLDSCKYNSTVDWLFFTDCDLSSFDVPANVQIIKSSFEEIKAKIQSLFGFKISLNKPYMEKHLQKNYKSMISGDSVILI